MPPFRRTMSVICTVTFLVLALCASSNALNSTVRPDDPIWTRTAGLPLFVRPSGVASIDSAQALGLREHWTDSPWSWGDTGEGRVFRDSARMPYLALISSTYKWKMFPGLFGGCEIPGYEKEGESCVKYDAAGFLSLWYVDKDSSREIAYEFTELLTWPDGEVLIPDIVRDLHAITVAMRADSIPALSLFSSNGQWPSIAMADLGRRACLPCSLLVAEEYGLRKNLKGELIADSLDAQALSQAFGLPVRVVPMAEICRARLERRQGIYLDASARSLYVSSRQVRTLDSGIVLAANSGRNSGRGNWIEHAEWTRPAGIHQADLIDLGHRMRGDERRVVFSASAIALANTTYFSKGPLLGYEIVRGIHGLAGYLHSSVLGALDVPDQHQLLLGVRWIPLLGYNAAALKSRIMLDGFVIQPLSATESPAMADPIRDPASGVYVEREGKRIWHAIPSLNAQVVANWSLLEVGGGLRLPLGTEIESSDDFDPIPKSGDAAFFLRFGIRTEWSAWKRSPAIWKMRLPPRQNSR